MLLSLLLVQTLAAQPSLPEPKPVERFLVYPQVDQKVGRKCEKAILNLLLYEKKWGPEDPSFKRPEGRLLFNRAYGTCPTLRFQE